MIEPSLYNLKNQGKKQGKNTEFWGEKAVILKKDGVLKSRGRGF